MNTDETQDLDQGETTSQEGSFVVEPQTIGRYRVLKLLGQGGFGLVYLAHDEQLNRPVAVKVPHARLVSRPEDAQAYLDEARTVANLDHPNIVPVYDVGSTDEYPCYVVSKFIDGESLAARIGHERPTSHEAADLVATIAGALHYAHTHGGLVHRDIKPGNILIDRSGNPFVVDFGLALKDEDFGKGGGLAGTPSYMSPEQARGEGHLVDGRSDIFSLAVVFYELLTGRRPFRGDSLPQIIEQVTQAEARPPRQIDDAIPKELERICQKALSKRASERYSTAKDMAEDLRSFLQTTGGTGLPLAPAVPRGIPPGSTLETAPSPSTSRPSDSDQRPIKIVPKGLRSFDQQDADFFLELLPGPRDRDGLPDSIRFWKGKIEQIDPDLTFRVGLIYGPSGCGKSSLIKAGLLPRLGKHVLTVYVEVTAEETEARLLNGIRKTCPELARGLGLVDSLAQLRRGRILPPERKVLLVLDQFEQWLHARRGEENTELVAALRHCDGEHVQAIVLVRDDFWLAACRFTRDLEIRVVEGENSALVDLFDPRHAKKVLMAFGRAYGALPDNIGDLNSEQESFLDQSISGLAQDGKIVSVRLALFAEMIKGKLWTPRTLHEVGGTAGVGQTFLEETFSASTAPPEHRFHQKAAQSVLRALLPESGTDIKGQMRSRQELLEASSYANHPRGFDDLIRILDSELRLITPTDRDGSPNEAQQIAPSRHYYQLTHDFLVPSLRDWLTRKQRETRRGRAEPRLAERSASWNAKPENRHLPSALEWANIRLFTRKGDWTAPQRTMMKRSGRLHSMRALVLALLISMISWGGMEGYGRLRASDLVESLQKVGTPDVPAIINQLSGYHRWADPQLERLVQSADDESREHLHASLALLPVDATEVGYLFNRLLTATPSELPVLRDALEPHRSTLIPKLWTVLGTAKPGDANLLPSASALASYDPQNARWDAVGDRVAEALVSVNLLLLRPWIDNLHPVRTRLASPLAVIFRDRSRPEPEHALATDILANYASDDPRLIADLMMDSDPNAYRAFFPIAQLQGSMTLPLFQAELDKKANTSESKIDSERIKDRRAERQARAAITLLRMGKAGEIIPLLRHDPDPRLRSYIVNWLQPLGAEARILAAEFNRLPTTAKLTPAQGQLGMDVILFHPEASERRALILALGTFGTERLSPGEREPLIAKLVGLYCDDPDSGIHGAAEWTLRQWGQEEKLNEADARLLKVNDWGDRRWFINRQGQTFAVIDGPVEFRMGSPPNEPDRLPGFTPHLQIIPRRFAIAHKEVSVEQYQQFMKENPQFSAPQNYLDKYSPESGGPMIEVRWFGGAAYCNWLSKKEGLREDQWCYLPNEQGVYDAGMKIPANALRRKGYRLPTEAEWEYACRAGSGTSRYYGFSIDLVPKYAWYVTNSEDHAHKCGSLFPNDLGLFDMLGNVFEWCQNPVGDDGSRIIDPIHDEIIKNDITRILMSGSFDVSPAYIRSANRLSFAPTLRFNSSGFRLARTCP
jgi:serine/threonine protein kinase/formylglycine-generating enzyme required for sulfatase activity